ncbi:MAG: S1 family peptidase [Gammaproteobacteria bacterium]|nr:S1 family peptidase [Gammaproteobacteria bacterium]
MNEVRSSLLGHSHKLLGRANVVAAGAGYKVTGGKRTQELSLVCSVARKLPLASLAAEDRVPKEIEGVPTDVIETGVIRALATRTERRRPAPGGVSIGHRDITAGTLGCLVKKNGQVMILSNNHVLANSNDAQTGDPILQPGPIDGGKLPADLIAELLQFVPINFGDPPPPSDCKFASGMIALLNAGCRVIGSRTRYSIHRLQATDNLVDAAIARPLNAADVSDDILEIGRIAGQGRGELGMPLQKSGRTTGFTQGEITQVAVTVDVSYGPGRTARFTDQLMAGAMSQGGDSGSAVLDGDRRLVGLLFAGSDNSTIINRIEHVFSALGLSL